MLSDMKKQIKATDAAAIPAPAIDKAAAKEDRHFVTALARGLSVLSCFSLWSLLCVSSVESSGRAAIRKRNPRVLFQ